ncbi:Alpha-1,3-arabinosyltransferase XAT3, partial [Linum perenne]
REDVGAKVNSESNGIRSEFRDIRGDIRIHPYSLTIYIVKDDRNNSNSNTSSIMWNIKPYPEDDNNPGSLTSVTTWSVKMVSSENQHDYLPQCHDDMKHDSPGIFFSLGGYAGNHFHGFADVLIPLFATARPFNRQVQLVTSDPQPWMLHKVEKFMQALSRYDVVAIDDKEKQRDKIHCFNRLILGLKGRHRRKELSINPLDSEYTIQDFRNFLRSTYSLNKTSVNIKVVKDEKFVPQLIIMSRRRTRTLTNADQIASLATSLGYKVVAVEELDDDMSRTAKMINSCDVLMGVHGAGLTNMVFLPDNAVLIQVVPLYLNWQADTYYEEPTRDMKLRYVEYKIGREESSLANHYLPNDTVFTDPFSFEWDAFNTIYLQNQNITLDIQRFKPTLLKALDLLHQE